MFFQSRKGGHVILGSLSRALYVGVTADLVRRLEYFLIRFAVENGPVQYRSSLRCAAAVVDIASAPSRGRKQINR